MFAPYDSPLMLPLSSSNYEPEDAPEPDRIDYALEGISRFTGLFSLGITVTLLARWLTALLPFYWIGAIAHHAELAGYQQVAQLQSAERLYPQMAPYLSDVQDADYQDVPASPPPQAPPQPMAATAAPEASAMPVTRASAPTADTTAYLQNFLEYPGLLFGGMGSGKSWTARYLVMQKVRAGHQVILLDPHADNHEWKSIRHIGAGMDYHAIAEFLQWYLDEIERRYQSFNRSGLTEEDWQQSLRQQQRITRWC
ncbi:MAG: ATP-binding protein [Tildeniella nuda ZEHNDER 1965/U140]|jgi:hypothetical protein|nr:ATP-binding protein [Tildeniella nuda ZEHNDER 1965/U140]